MHSSSAIILRALQETNCGAGYREPKQILFKFLIFFGISQALLGHDSSARPPQPTELEPSVPKQQLLISKVWRIRDAQLLVNSLWGKPYHPGMDSISSLNYNIFRRLILYARKGSMDLWPKLGKLTVDMRWHQKDNSRSSTPSSISREPKSEWKWKKAKLNHENICFKAPTTSWIACYSYTSATPSLNMPNSPRLIRLYHQGKLGSLSW